MKTALKHLIIDGDMSATIISETIETDQLYMGSFQASRSGTATGSYDIEASNDGINFVQVSSVALASNHQMITLTEIPYKYIRFVFTFATNTGTLNVYQYAKGV